MADGQDPSTAPDQSYSFGAGGDPYSNPMALLALGGGMRGAGGDPYLAMLQPQLQYAQGLLGQAAQAGPVASPWQAAARAVSGALGGWQLADYGQQYQRTLAGEVEQARQHTQDALSEAALSGGGLQGAGPTAPPQATAAPANMDALLSAASAKSGIPKPVLVGLYKHESDFNPAAVNKDSGATGLGQVLISTALKPEYGMQPLADNEDAAKAALLDPAKNVDFSSQYLAARGKGLFGDKWNPADPTQIKAALNAYGDGTAGYADAVLSKGGANVPNVPIVTAAQNDATMNPQANMQAGWQAALRLQLRAAQMAASPNSYDRAAVPQLMQIASTLKQVGLWSSKGTDPATGQTTLVNNMTGDTKAVGAGLRPEGVAMKDLAELAPIAQADPNLLQGGNRQRLQTAITQIYKPTITLDTATGIQQFHWEHPPPAWAKTFMGDTSGAGPSSATSGKATAPSTPEAIKALTEQSNKDIADANKDLDAATQQSMTTIPTLQRVRSLLPHVATGAGTSDFVLGAGQLLQRLGVDAKTVENITNIDPSKGELMGKALFDLLGDRIKEQGGVRAQAIWNTFQRALPSLDSRPETIDTLTRMYETAINYEQKYQQDRFDYLNGQRQSFFSNSSNGYQGIGSFNRDFLKNNDPKIWGAAALAAGKQSNSVWRAGLNDDEANAAVNLANGWWPGTPMYGTDNKLHIIGGKQ